MKKIFVTCVLFLIIIGVGICQAEETDPVIITGTDLFTPYQDGMASGSIARELVKDGVLPEEQSGGIRVGTPNIQDKPITRSQAITTKNPQVNKVKPLRQ